MKRRDRWVTGALLLVLVAFVTTAVVTAHAATVPTPVSTVTMHNQVNQGTCVTVLSTQPSGTHVYLHQVTLINTTPAVGQEWTLNVKSPTDCTTGAGSTQVLARWGYGASGVNQKFDFDFEGTDAGTAALVFDNEGTGGQETIFGTITYTTSSTGAPVSIVNVNNTPAVAVSSAPTFGVSVQNTPAVAVSSAPTLGVTVQNTPAVTCVSGCIAPAGVSPTPDSLLSASAPAAAAAGGLSVMLVVVGLGLLITTLGVWRFIR